MIQIGDFGSARTEDTLWAPVFVPGTGQTLIDRINRRRQRWFRRHFGKLAYMLPVGLPIGIWSLQCYSSLLIGYVTGTIRQRLGHDPSAARSFGKRGTRFSTTLDASMDAAVGTASTDYHRSFKIYLCIQYLARWNGVSQSATLSPPEYAGQISVLTREVNCRS